MAGSALMRSPGTCGCSCGGGGGGGSGIGCLVCTQTYTSVTLTANTFANSRGIFTCTLTLGTTPPIGGFPATGFWFGPVAFIGLEIYYVITNNLRGPALTSCACDPGTFDGIVQERWVWPCPGSELPFNTNVCLPFLFNFGSWDGGGGTTGDLHLSP